MPRRTLYIVFGLAALLVLVGAGSAVLMQASRDDASAPPSRTSTPAGAPSVAAPRPPTTIAAASGTPAPAAGATSDLAEVASTVGPDLAARTATPPVAETPVGPSSGSLAPTPVAPVGEVLTATPVPEPPGQAAVVQVATLMPIPPPRPERVGGPVSIPNRHDGPRWVTLQVGHLRSASMPDELAHLRSSSGAYSAGVSEVSINEAAVQLTARYLTERGYSVDILDATVPVGYVTDLFLALHADGNESSSARGFKAVAPWHSGPEIETFLTLLYEEYGKATEMPSDPRSSSGMANYYAFNPLEYRHAVAPGVPATLIEMGFVTNPTDRRIMTAQTDRVAWGIANAVDRYFRSGVAGQVPTPYPSFTPTNTPTPTATHTPTETPTSTVTPTETPTPLPTEVVDGATATALVTTPSPTLPATATPRVPAPSATPVPSPTPLQGIITADGRWLPPLSPHTRGLPRPGSNGAPVSLDEDREDFVLTANGRERVQFWRQFYMPDIGRSVWKKSVARPVRH